jgi:aminomethyltransferase
MCKRSLTESTKPLAKTALYNYHLELGGKMVPFADYSLPVQYEGLGVMQEHLHTRAPNSAAVFDVSHMGQILWTGKDAVNFLEKMVVGDIKGLKAGESRLSLIMNEQGTIVDDTVITNAGDHIYMVVNGACKWKDMDHFKKYMSGFDVNMNYLENQQLLALQGKGAKTVLAALAPALNLFRMNFMTSTHATVAGIENCRVTRCGYTGEDGFEISVAEKDTERLARALMAQPNVKPAGLGARDSLRLEAGLCLYGNDIDETINPIEASLTWTIGGPKSRRRVEQGFLGAGHFLEPNGKLKPVTKKRVGISGMKAPARGHTEIFDKEGKKSIGVITSGGFGPTFQKPLAMGYVTTEHANEDTEVMLSVRGKMLQAKVTKMPFVATDYFKASP